MSHLSDIGFAFTRPEELLEFVEGVVNDGEAITTPRGYYVFWTPGEGVELWIRVDNQRRIVGCSLHYTGGAEMRVAVTQTFRHPERPLDGSLYGWADPKDDNPYTGCYPFAADMPDFDLVEERALHVPVITAQIAAFAQDLRCFRSDGEFISSYPDGEHPVSESVKPMWQQGEEPTPEATITGRIQQVDLRRNPSTGQEFYAMHVKTLGGDVDLVADPALTRGKPVENGIVAGNVWLSARVTSDLPLLRLPRYGYRRRH